MTSGYGAFLTFSLHCRGSGAAYPELRCLQCGLPAHPNGLARPKTPDDLRTMLIDRLPENLRDVIDVYVVDVSRPAGKAAPGT